MSDIVERLRNRAISYDESGPSAQHTSAMLREAADEIERLRDEVGEWKQAASVEAGLRREFADEIERLRENIECLTTNKWSDIELALADKKALEMWMALHGVTRLDDLLKARDDARDEIERLRTALQIFADDENWRYGRRLDPNSSRFDGTEIACNALKPKDVK